MLPPFTTIQRSNLLPEEQDIFFKMGHNWKGFRCQASVQEDTKVVSLCKNGRKYGGAQIHLNVNRDINPGGGIT